VRPFYTRATCSSELLAARCKSTLWKPANDALDLQRRRLLSEKTTGTPSASSAASATSTLATGSAACTRTPRRMRRACFAPSATRR
jgi:hypothetical protein